MSYTAEFLDEKVKEFEASDAYESPYTYSEGSIYEDLKNEEESSFDVPGIGKIEFVDEYGGEGQGDDYWVVFKTTETGQYWRVDGWYASHHGGELDGDAYEVFPEEVTVTQYNRKK